MAGARLMAQVSWPKGAEKWVAVAVGLFFVLLVGIEAYDRLTRPRFQIPVPPERVSIVQLLVSPDTYDGHRIQAAGYFVFEQEHHALYFTDAHAENGVAENSIALLFDYVSFPPDALREFNRKYVNVTGRFIASARSEWPMEIVIGR